MDFQNKDNFTKESIDELISFLKNENIKAQMELISAIKTDLGKTDDEQKSLRKYLTKQIKKIKILEKEYLELENNIS